MATPLGSKPQGLTEVRGATGRLTQSGQASATMHRHPPVARGAVAQGVASGAGVGEGIAMPQQVVPLVEGGSSRQGGASKPSTCSGPPFPPPHTHSPNLGHPACASGIHGSDSTKQAGVMVSLQHPVCSQGTLPSVATQQIMQVAWQPAAPDS